MQLIFSIKIVSKKRNIFCLFKKLHNKASWKLRFSLFLCSDLIFSSVFFLKNLESMISPAVVLFLIGRKMIIFEKFRIFFCVKNDLFDKENEIKEDFRYLFVYVRDWLQKALQCYFSEKFISLKDFFMKKIYIPMRIVNFLWKIRKSFLKRESFFKKIHFHFFWDLWF